MEPASEEILDILNIPISNLSMGDITLIERYLRDSFNLRGEFYEHLYDCVRDFYYDYLNQTGSIHRDDEPKPLKALKSFRTDTCVICLTKLPNVLFTDCRHICICLECEEIKPLGKCPYCRATISTKNIV